jgi:hypothetical protein
VASKKGPASEQHGDAAFVEQRLAPKADHLRVPDGSGVQVVDERTPSHPDGRRVEEIAHLPQNGEQPTGPEDVIHQEPACGLQVDEQWHVRANPVEIVKCQVDPDSPGNRQQVDHSVGRPADGGHRHDRVGERRAREECARPSVGGDHFHDQPSGPVGASRRLSAAGVPATPGTTAPSTSATSAIVDAVP